MILVHFVTVVGM